MIATFSQNYGRNIRPMIKIVFIIEHFSPHIGGGEKLFKELSDSLKNSGLHVRVVTSNSGGITGQHKVNGVQVFSYPWHSSFGHPLPRSSDLRAHVAWADIVQTAQYTAAPITIRLAKRLNKPCVFMAYEYLGENWHKVDGILKAAVFRVFEWWVFHQRYTHYISISESTKRDIVASGINTTKITRVYPVFSDFSKWQKTKVANSQLKHFLYYGRPGKTKGIFLLLEAIKLANNKLPSDIQFNYILSNDPFAEKQKLKKLIKQYRLGQRINVSDSLPEKDLIKEIQNSYCVVVPSLTEGFGYSAFQACVMGKNIIVSNAGSLPEVISGKGLIFENGNPRSLADAIIQASEGKFNHYKNRISPTATNIRRVIKIYENLLANLS